ncbi:lipoprotein [Spiroplasma phoeniceum]|uniref:Spiroplasma plectrovirus-related protein n=1 Tax=Spiroplasma phoeniceum P40 TaxID=1276259 RepID=A0A345DP62_9MOLU|nr:lipoprotein [Spiroplasma phoeniceum]AXF96000.1 spiroplasma plectrovirus-related protein [Spiroplasma phoeniceum P40]
MKRILSIIGAIGLTATSTTTLISCKKENNNENEKDNIPITPTTEEQPPKDNYWKEVLSVLGEGNTNKWYIGIFKKNNKWNIIKWNGNKEFYSYYYDKVYRWDGVGEPETPTINKNTGEINNWKEQKGTE